MQLPVYLDYHATTPVDPRVLEAMTPYFTGVWQPGLAGPRLRLGGRGRGRRLSRAGRRAMNASPREIVFTSGATESDNLAILGVARLFGQKERGRHVITSPAEHSAVLDCCGSSSGRASKSLTSLPRRRARSCLRACARRSPRRRFWSA